MERLTDRTENGLICLNNDCKLSNPLLLAMKKLAEFEDFMEEKGFESLEELEINIEYLKDKIKTDKFNYEQLHKFKNHLQEENAKLKRENEFLNKEFKINKMFNKLFKIALEDENGAIDKIFDILRKEFKEVE